MLRDSSSFERQIIDAVRSVNRALGGATGSTALNRSDYNQYEVQLIDAIRAIGRTLSGNGLSVAGGGGAVDMSGYATVLQFQDLSRRVTKLENESFFRLVDGNVTLKEEYQNLWVPGWLSAGGIGTGSSGGGGSSYLKELLDVYHGGNGVLRADGTAVVAGDALVYNATLGWVASPVSGGGGSSVVVTQSTASGVQTTTISVDGVGTEIAVKAVSFGTQGTDKIPITIGATTKNVLTAHQSLSGYVPTSRQVNGHPLTGDVTVTKGDIGLGNVENTKLSTWTGSQNITTLGTISTGVWNGTAIGVTKGGTGLTSIAKGAILYASANNVLSALAPNGTSTKKFLSQTGSNAPGWGTLSTSDITNIETWISGKAFATQSALDALSGTVDSLSSGLSSLSGRVDGLESDLSSLSARVTSIEGWFEVVTVNGKSALHAKSGRAIYSDSWISSGGVGTGTGSGGASTLEELYDVTITSKSDGDLLLYNASSGRWINMRRANFLSGLATQDWVNQQGFLKTYTETDPTVPSWAKASTKPSYSLSEISGTDDLRAIEALTGSGFLKRTGDNAWSLDNTTYLASGTTLDSIEDGTTRKLSNYLPLSGGTMTGAITMSGANILTSADSTNNIGSSSARFNTGYIRNIYTTFFAFMSNDGQTQRGALGMGEDYASISFAGTPIVSYHFYRGAGFFHNGNGDVPCGRSDHRWEKVWSVDADLSGGLSIGGDIVPSADLGSQLGYSNRRFSNLNVRTIGSVKEINFKDSNNSATTGYLSFQNGYMLLRAGSNINSSYKQINLHETYGFYPETAGVNLGYNGANYRWANIYGVNADFTGDLAVASTSHIDIGPLRIEYDATNKALHITKKDGNDTNTYGLYADGFVSSGGVGQTS